MRRKPAATPAFLLGAAVQQTPPSSRRRPGPITTVTEDLATCFRKRPPRPASMSTEASGSRPEPVIGPAKPDPLAGTTWRELCAITSRSTHPRPVIRNRVGHTRRPAFANGGAALLLDSHIKTFDQPLPSFQTSTRAPTAACRVSCCRHSDGPGGMRPSGTRHGARRHSIRAGRPPSRRGSSPARTAPFFCAPAPPAGSLSNFPRPRAARVKFCMVAPFLRASVIAARKFLHVSGGFRGLPPTKGRETGRRKAHLGNGRGLISGLPEIRGTRQRLSASRRGVL